MATEYRFCAITGRERRPNVDALGSKAGLNLNNGSKLGGSAILGGSQGISGLSGSGSAGGSGVGVGGKIRDSKNVKPPPIDPGLGIADADD